MCATYGSNSRQDTMVEITHTWLFTPFTSLEVPLRSREMSLLHISLVKSDAPVRSP